VQYADLLIAADAAARQAQGYDIDIFSAERYAYRLDKYLAQVARQIGLNGWVSRKQAETTGKPPHRVARAGLARTFQTIRLFGELTVLENVAVAGMGVGQSRHDAVRDAGRLLEEMELAEWADRLASEVPFGHQRRLEIARALVTKPKFLLLDEPAAGLNEEESDHLLWMLLDIPERRGVGMLIVDHDMRLMMNLCSTLHVLNYGRTIAHGTPEEVRANPEVVSAYLGGAA